MSFLNTLREWIRDTLDEVEEMSERQDMEKAGLYCSKCDRYTEAAGLNLPTCKCEKSLT